MEGANGKTAEGIALSECIRSARNRAGLLQEELATLADVGTSTLRQIESGAATGTSIFTVFRILNAANASLEDLDDVFHTAHSARRDTALESPRKVSPRSRGRSR